jgi:hypothetical protein
MAFCKVVLLAKTSIHHWLANAKVFCMIRLSFVIQAALNQKPAIKSDRNFQQDAENLARE